MKFVHNWGVHLLGGTLVSSAALPYLYEHLDPPFGQGSKAGFGNSDIQPAVVAYRRGSLNWWYGLDLFTPGFSYNKSELLNVGQHNYAVAPSGAITYLPGHGTELSSKVQYITNGKNGATQYQSGNELVWEYDGMKNVARKVALGVNGFFYQQTTDDTQNGFRVGDGNRGRDLALGPQVRCHFGKLGLIVKYQRDMLTQYKPIGNSFWLQFDVPIGRGHE